jgi:hypothetical protein
MKHDTWELIAALSVIAALWAVSFVSAQSPAKPLEEITQADRAILTDLQSRMAALEYAKNILQKEQDAAQGEFARQVDRLRRPGLNLDLATGRYVPIATPPPVPTPSPTSSPKKEPKS